MKDTAKAKNKVLTMHDKDLYPAVKHVTIVRPRYQKHLKNWIIRLINEKGTMVRSYELVKEDNAILVHKSLLNIKVDEEIKARLWE